MLLVSGAVLASVVGIAVLAGTISAQRGNNIRHDSGAFTTIAAPALTVADNVAEAVGVDTSPSGLLGWRGRGDATKAIDKIEALVDAGDLNQADGDALIDWYGQRPEIEILDGAGFRRSGIEMSPHEDLHQSDKLANLVEAGVLSQADADALAAWYEVKPEVDLPDYDLAGRLERGSKRDFEGFGRRGFHADRADHDHDHDSADLLAELVEREVMSQADADALTAWFDAAPEVDLAEAYGIKEFMDQDGDGVGRFPNFDDALASAVEDGDITQAEADAVSDWLDDVPDVTLTIGEGVKTWAFGRRGDRGASMLGNIPDMLAMVGIITADEASAIGDWIDEMPDIDLYGGKLLASVLKGDRWSPDGEPSELDVAAMLDDLVAEEALSRENADALLAWWNDKPAVVDTLMDALEEQFSDDFGRRGFRRFGRDRDSSDGIASFAF